MQAYIAGIQTKVLEAHTFPDTHNVDCYCIYTQLQNTKVNTSFQNLKFFDK